MKDFAYFSNTFNVSKTPTYQLSLALHPSDVCYTIIDTVRNKCVAIKNVGLTDVYTVQDYYKQVEKVIAEDTFLSKNYKKMNFVFASNKSTLVPLEFFNKNLLKDYFTMNHQLDEYEEIHFNKILDLKMVNVFSIPSDITTLMVNHFPELHFYHQSSTLISNLTKSSKSKGLIVGILVDKHFFDIVVADKGELKLYNNIKYSNEEDFVYHVMNVYNQLDIPISGTNLYLSGDIEKKYETYDLLKNYVSNIWFSKTLAERNITYNFKEVSEHVFSNLLSI